MKQVAKVFFHNNGGLWVFRGATLKVNGTREEPVIFQGDRLQERFDDLPGQWDRIWINEGGENEINHAIIRNSFIGIQAEALFLNESQPSSFGRLTINNTIIENCSNTGLLSSLFELEANNLLVSNCGEANLFIQAAGTYQFNHCTFANYFSLAQRETPAFFVSNALSTPLGIAIDTPNIQMRNSIVQGSLESEFNTQIIEQGSIGIDFANVILKTDQDVSNPNQFKNIIHNPSREIFIDPRMGDYHLIENSPAINSGDINIANQIPEDLDGNSRTVDGSPDLGVYEFAPE